MEHFKVNPAQLSDHQKHPVVRISKLAFWHPHTLYCIHQIFPGSPYMAQIVPQTDYFPEKVRAYGPGLENGVKPKEKTFFMVDVSEAGEAPLDVAIRDDLGEFAPKVDEFIIIEYI